MVTKKEIKKDLVRVYFSKERVLTENSDAARELYNQSRFGTLLPDGKLQLTLIETLYLLEKKQKPTRQLRQQKGQRNRERRGPQYWEENVEAYKKEVSSV